MSKKGTSKNKTATKSAPYRLRLSAWVDSYFFVNGTGKRGTPNFKPKVVLLPGKGQKVNLDILFRKDDPENAAVRTPVNDGKQVKKGKLRVIDDISLLRTFINKDNSMEIEWDRSFLRGGMMGKEKWDSQRKKLHEMIRKHCHEELGTQILAGFTVIQEPNVSNPRHDVFDKWLQKDKPVPSIEEVVNNIMQFYVKNLPGYDGISFDIEGLTKSKNQKVTNTMIKNMTEFYRILAKKLEFPFGDQILAFAAGGMISDTKTAGNIDPAVGSALVQRFVIAKGSSNIIVRPMAYDAFNKYNKNMKLVDDWHEKIINYALNTVQLDPSQFQLGIKTIPPGIKSTNDATMTNPLDIQRRCVELRNKHKVGLALFPTSSGLWSFCNMHLNLHKEAREAGRLGHPRQFPHNTVSIKSVNHDKFKKDPPTIN